MGLTLMLDADLDNYYCSSTSSSGFKVLLHSPIEIPRIASFGFFVAPGRETKVVITPKITEASESIRKIPIEKRQCIFENEANLSYYNIYTKKNCEMECISKITEDTCGCTLYYMPRKFNNDSIICNRKKAPCYEKILFNIAHSQNEEYSCSHCLPACYEINYEREISASRLGTGNFITREMFPNHDANYIENNLAMIHIFFLENSYGGYTKTEFIGFTDFLSNIGGLLGLFMGFSVISILEIIYFVSLRPYYVGKRHAEQTRMKTFDPSKNRINGIIGTYLVGPLYLDKVTATWKTPPKITVWQRLVNGLRCIRDKITSLWKAFIGCFKKEEKAPFPYCN